MFDKFLIEKIFSQVVSKNFRLVSKFVCEIQDELMRNTFNWKNMSRCWGLSTEFIEKFQDKVYWHDLSWYQTLNETLIEKYQDKVIWIGIYFSQTFSDSFKLKWKHKFKV